MLDETEVVEATFEHGEEEDDDAAVSCGEEDCFKGGSGARRKGSVVGRLIFTSFVGKVISDIDEDVDDDDDEQLIDVFSNFSLNSRIRLLFDHLTLLRGLLAVC